MRAGEAYLGIKCSSFEGVIFQHLVWLQGDIFTNGVFLSYISDN